MKRIILPLAGLLALGSSLALAATSSALEANIPFQFTAGETTFAPGKYEIRTHPAATKGSLEVTNLATHKTVKVDAKTVTSKEPRKTELVFHRYRDKEYLWMVNEEGGSSGLEVLSKAEMALQKAGKKRTAHSQMATRKMMSQPATPSAATQPASKPASPTSAAKPAPKPPVASKTTSGTSAKTKADQSSKKAK